MKEFVKSAGLAALAALLLGASAFATAQTLIFTCVDASGKRFSSDRPLIECSGREQRVLNSDGSLNRLLPPPMTPDERAAHEERERRTAADRIAKIEAARRDRNLLARYPNEAAHEAARTAALDDIRSATRTSQARLVALAAERKPLMVEAEFFAGKALPAKLRGQLDAIDAAVDAQKSLNANQQAEVVRLNALFDADLGRLRKLWAGAEPGSTGSLQASVAMAASASAPRNAAR
ncbi:MAG: hypothetical protein ABIO45_07680 [Burkholderiaceae bacterium]